MYKWNLNPRLRYKTRLVWPERQITKIEVNGYFWLFGTGKLKEVLTPKCLKINLSNDYFLKKASITSLFTIISNVARGMYLFKDNWQTTQKNYLISQTIHILGFSIPSS